MTVALPLYCCCAGHGLARSTRTRTRRLDLSLFLRTPVANLPALACRQRLRVRARWRLFDYTATLFDAVPSADDCRDRTMGTYGDVSLAATL